MNFTYRILTLEYASECQVNGHICVGNTFFIYYSLLPFVCMSSDGVPSDGIPLVVITHSSFAVLAIGNVYFAVGVALSIIFLVFTLRYQNTQ